MLIFIDESGDLGFDRSKPGVSSTFVMTALVLDGHARRTSLEKGVERTLKNKLDRGNRTNASTLELKGGKTSFQVKSYFWKQVQDVQFSVFTAVLQKASVPPASAADGHRLYNHMTCRLMDLIPWTEPISSLHVEIDRSKAGRRRVEFDDCLSLHLGRCSPPGARFTIRHSQSTESKCIQAVDLFGWGIARKHGLDDLVWYSLYASKIVREETVHLQL